MSRPRHWRWHWSPTFFHVFYMQYTVARVPEHQAYHAAHKLAGLARVCRRRGMR